ncbi:MAG: hypothetical protein LBQ50_11865 [Planctomycetaceae bacterium]|jgi:hypothetical protein|nr:hypothetical protein [Planctomycetaceae bacterium]
MFYDQKLRSPHSPLQRGLSTVVALVVLAVVGTTVMLLTQTIIRERLNNARKQQIIQANLLVDDLYRIAEKQKQNISVTIPASALHTVADLRLTATVEGEVVTTTGEYVAEILPADRHYSTQKSNQKSTKTKK